jgi:C-terminal processing protease CtpA/Prc
VGTTGDPENSRYVRSAYDAIRGVSTAATCGWVVELRRNTGGSLPPMLQAVAPILGDGKAVGYRDRNGTTRWFAIENGTLAGMGPAVAVTGRPPRLRRLRPPVAVLTSRLTGSSGEGVVMAFHGRPDSRSLGEPTAGVPTGNAGYPLSDRAELYLTEGIGVDRAGATYQARIQPDRPVATDWTRYGSPADPCCRPRLGGSRDAASADEAAGASGSTTARGVRRKARTVARRGLGAGLTSRRSVGSAGSGG